MKYTDLPFPGTNNEKVRAEVAAAVNRVDQAKGGGAQELTDCLQAAIDHLGQYVAPPYIPGELFFADESGDPIEQSGSLGPISPEDVLTPSYVLQVEGEEAELVGPTDPRLRRLQVSQVGGGFGTSNDWFVCDQEAGTITALDNPEAPPAIMNFRREIEVDRGEEGRGVYYAFATFDWVPVE